MHTESPENGEIIQAVVFVDENNVYGGNFSKVIVRKLVFENGRIVRKEALLFDGSWIIVKEGDMYPEVTYLPIAGLHTPETEAELQGFMHGEYPIYNEKSEDAIGE